MALWSLGLFARHFIPALIGHMVVPFRVEDGKAAARVRGLPCPDLQATEPFCGILVATP